MFLDFPLFSDYASDALILILILILLLLLERLLTPGSAVSTLGNHCMQESTFIFATLS